MVAAQVEFQPIAAGVMARAMLARKACPAMLKSSAGHCLDFWTRNVRPRPRHVCMCACVCSPTRLFPPIFNVDSCCSP